MKHFSTLTETEIEDLTISCPNCKKQLITLCINKLIPATEKRIYADCGWCGQRSFRVDVKNKMHFSATKDSRIMDIQESTTGDTIFKTIKGNQSFGEF